jgi:hypothetical protein
MKIEDIKVKTVSVENLEKFLAIELPENQKLNIDKFAVFEDKFGIDIDCCFWDLQSGHFNDKIQKVVDVDCRIKHYKEDGSSTMRMDKPDFVKTISLDDYISISEEVNLVDFIRFNYNPRISQNQSLLMKYIREACAVS